MPAADGRSLGLTVLVDLERGLTLGELRAQVGSYAASTAYDRTLRQFIERTSPALNLGVADHRSAMLVWLRSWGCRNLNRSSEAISSAALAGWAETWPPLLPARSKSLAGLSPDEITTLAVAYAHLAGTIAGARRHGTGDRPVVFGPTAAAKIMYAVRPKLCAPWDEPIRDALGLGDNDAAYRAYLHLIAVTLTNTARQAETTVEQLPKLVGRPESSPTKLIDEYLWMRITRS